MTASRMRRRTCKGPPALRVHPLGDERPATEEALGFCPVGDTAEYSIGSEVTCSDGICGELSRVVVDPVARALTHLVVEPKHRQGQGHLVPIDLVDATAEKIELRCTSAEFDALEAA